MYSRIRRETSTLRKHWYLQGKTHIFSPRTHRGRMNMRLKNTVFFIGIQGKCFRQLFAHFGAWNVPKLPPNYPKMIFKMNEKTWLNQHLVKRVPNRLQNTILPPPPRVVTKGSILSTLGVQSCPNWTYWASKATSAAPGGLHVDVPGAPKCAQDAI